MKKVVFFGMLAMVLALLTIPTADLFGMVIYTPKYLNRTPTQYLREDLRLQAELSVECYLLGGYRFDEPNRCAIGERWETLPKPAWFLERKLNPDYYPAIWGTIGIVALLTIEFLGVFAFAKLSHISLRLWRGERER